MEKKIIINGKEYDLKPIDFNAMCELEDLGLSIEELKGKSMSAIRALVAFVEKKDVTSAGKDIDEHMKKDGKINDFKPLFNMLQESDFFRNISKQ